MVENVFYSLGGPLDVAPIGRQMRAANFTGFADFVRGRGGNARAILERHELDIRSISDPDSHIDSKSLADVLEYCGTHFDDPLFGLKLAQTQESDVFGCVTALCRAAPTFGEAVKSWIEYIPLAHSPVAILELVEGGETSEIRWAVGAQLGANTQANYQAAALNMKLLRGLGGKGFRPSYVNLAVNARSADATEVEDALGCSFNGDAQMNAIAFPSAMMAHPVPSANRLLYRLIGGYLERVRNASRKTIVEQVEDYVRGSLQSGNCSIERCAKRLGASVRTLQSNLGERGVRFSDILEHQRIALAKTYLEEDGLALDEVAIRLGYSEQSSFGRAFKRWTGSTPQVYRAMRGSDAR
jgi:AraC-like DNA-binding protein